MTKSDLIERLCQDEKLPKGKAELLVNTVFECLEEALRRGERIEIRGFGSFEIRRYKSYQGRNPKTGVPVSVEEKRLPFFKVGKELKERVNGAADAGSDGSPSRPPPTAPSSNGHGPGSGPPASGMGGGAGSSGTREGASREASGEGNDSDASLRGA
jgi:integration host factor subunit beta